MDNALLNGRYEILRPIGFGGMAEVYLAHDTLLDRNVAIKMLRDQFISDRELLAQFRREAKSAARLIHPYIINIYDVVSEGDKQYIVMEYVEGVTLKEYMEEHRLKLNAVLEIAVRLADALQHAHSRNIIHCDVKPQNILLDKDLNPKIADFGIAKMVSSQTMVYTASVMGSVHYISPEQAEGGQITARSDVYSLGVVIFEMLTGRVPFTGRTAMSVAMMHAKKDAPPLSDFLENVPEGLQAIMDKTLAKNPQDRYADAGELRRDLVDLKMRLFPFGSDSYKKDMAPVTVKSAPVKQEEEADGDATVIMQPRRQQEKERQLFDIEEVEQSEQQAVQEENAVSLPEEEEELAAARKKTTAKKNTFGLNKFTRAVIILTAIVVAASVCAHFFFNRATLVVPEVTGLTVAEAQKKLEGAGFEVELEERYGEKAQPGTVMLQSPAASEKRKEGSTIYLTVSMGAELKKVPDLEGMTLEEAKIQLKNSGYVVGKITKKYVAGKKLGVVLAQSPKALDKSPVGSAVDLTVNAGNIAVPDIMGKKIKDAEKILARAGLKIGATKQVANGAAKGVVVAMEPKAGEYTEKGAAVDVSVSTGSNTVGEKVSVPDSGSSDTGESRYVEFIVPDGGRQHVQIYIKDERGRNLVYDANQKGGVRIRQKIEARQGAAVQLYSDNKLVEEKVL